MSPKAQGKRDATGGESKEKKPRGWNLAQHFFKSGAEWSGNAGGRPKKKPITERYERDLEQLAPDHICQKLGLPRDSTLGDCAARATLLRSIIGKDVSHMREITDRLEGKAQQSVSVKMEVTDKLSERLREARKRAGIKK